MSELNLRPAASGVSDVRRDSRAGTAISPEDVVVEQVEPLGWCVRDWRFPEDDRSSSIGFIEENKGTFEVMQLGSEVRFLTFQSFEAAVEHLTAYIRQSESASFV